MGRTVLSAGGADPGQMVSVPNLPLTAGDAVRARPPRRRGRRAGQLSHRGPRGAARGGRRDRARRRARAGERAGASRARRSATSAGGTIRTTTGCRPPALAEGSVLAADLDPIPGVSSRLALVGRRRKEAVRGARPPRRAGGAAQRPGAARDRRSCSWSRPRTSAGAPTSATTCASAPSCPRPAPRPSPTTTPRTPRRSTDGTVAGLPGARRRRRLPLHRRPRR